jgi:flagellar hook-associated protein 2
MATINPSSLSVGADGKISFSGLTSGIDFQSIIDTSVQARRAQAIQIEQKIQSNTERISTFEELRTLSDTFRDTLDNLRGSTSFFATDVFKSKIALATSAAAATAPANYTPTEATSLMAATVTSDADAGAHKIIIQQLAKANQVRADVIDDKTADLTTKGITAGSFTLNGETITVNAGDSLIDLQDKINASAANVNATIVSASSTQFFLVLTSASEGTANAIDFGTATQTSFDLGLTTANSGAAVIKTELQAAQNSILDVNGITGITRSTNEIDDIIEGVTLSLFQAEVDTEITLDIETDLNTVKTELINFVDAYNAIRDFFNDQRTEVDRDLTVDADGDGDATNDKQFGPLAFDTTLRQIMDRLTSLIVADIPQLQDGFQNLAQIGITVGEDFRLSIDDDTLDNKLITNVDAVRKVFVADFTSSDARLRYVNNTDNTTSGTYYVNIAGTDTNGDITSANIQTATVVGNGGADDGSLTLSSNNILQGTNTTGADGLKVLFNDSTPSLGAIDDITVTLTRGVADQLFYFFDGLVKLQGTFDDNVESLTAQNEDFQDQITVIDTRIETFRAALERRFLAMETALAELENIRSTITQFVDGQNQGG